MNKFYFVLLAGILFSAGCVPKSKQPTSNPDPNTLLSESGKLAQTSHCPSQEELENLESLLVAQKEKTGSITAILEFTKIQTEPEFLNRSIPLGTSEIFYLAVDQPGGGSGVVQNEKTFLQMLNRYIKNATYNNPNPPKFGISSIKIIANANEILSIKNSMPKSYIIQIRMPEDSEREKALRQAGGKTIYAQGLIIECGIK